MFHPRELSFILDRTTSQQRLLYLKNRRWVYCLLEWHLKNFSFSDDHILLPITLKNATILGSFISWQQWERLGIFHRLLIPAQYSIYTKKENNNNMNQIWSLLIPLQSQETLLVFLISDCVKKFTLIQSARKFIILYWGDGAFQIVFYKTHASSLFLEISSFSIACGTKQRIKRFEMKFFWTGIVTRKTLLCCIYLQVQVKYYNWSTDFELWLREILY